MNFTRRHFLFVTASTAFVPYTRHRAYALDPLTCLQAGAAIVGIITGIAGVGSDDEFKKRLAEINAKLDQIVRLQVSILEELQSLKLFITEALVRDRRDGTANALNAQKDRFDILTATPVSSNTRPLYDRLTGDVEQSTFEISRFDFSAYISFSTGIAIDLAIYRLVSADRARLAVLRAKVHEIYSNWLDTNSAQSVTYLIAQVEGDIGAAIAKLTAKPRQQTLREYRKGGSLVECEWSTVLTVNGDFEAGFSGTVAEVKGRCERIMPPCSRTMPCFLDYENPPPSHSIAGVPAKIPETSGYALVDEFNRERNQIIDQMNRVVNLYSIKGQLEQLRDTFK